MTLISLHRKNTSQTRSRVIFKKTHCVYIQLCVRVVCVSLCRCLWGPEEGADLLKLESQAAVSGKVKSRATSSWGQPLEAEPPHPHFLSGIPQGPGCSHSGGSHYQVEGQSLTHGSISKHILYFCPSRTFCLYLLKAQASFWSWVFF